MNPAASAGVHRLELRVYAADTDLSGIVHHSQYLVFAERARTEMLRDFAVAEGTLTGVEHGYWIVRRVSLDYRRPARLDDLIVIETRGTATRGASADLEQRFSRGGELLAEMAVTVAYLTAEGRPARMPPAWRDGFARLATRAAAAW